MKKIFILLVLCFFSIAVIADNHITIENITKLKPVTVLSNHNALVKAIALHENTLIVASYNSINFWDAEKLVLLRRWLAHTHTIEQLFIDKNFLISIDVKGLVKIWNLKTADFIKDFQGIDKGWLSAAAFENNTLALADEYGNVALWNIEHQEKINYFTNDYIVKSLVLKDNLLVFGDKEGFVKILDLKTQHIIKQWKIYHKSIVAMAMRTDKKQLAFSSIDNKLWLLNVEDEKTIALQSHQAKITALVFSPDNQILASSSLDNTIKFWNADTGDLVHNLIQKLDVRNIYFYPDKFISAGVNRKAIIWAVK